MLRAAYCIVERLLRFWGLCANCVSDFANFETSRNSEHKGAVVADVILAHHVIIHMIIIVIGNTITIATIILISYYNS